MSLLWVTAAARLVHLPIEEVRHYDSPEFDSDVQGVHDQFHDYYRGDSDDARAQREEQQALIDSVRAHGVQKPIHVALPAADDDPQVPMLLDGHHRVSAAISAGATHVPAYLHEPVTDEHGVTDYPTYFEEA